MQHTLSTCCCKQVLLYFVKLLTCMKDLLWGLSLKPQRRSIMHVSSFTGLGTCDRAGETVAEQQARPRQTGLGICLQSTRTCLRKQLQYLVFSHPVCKQKFLESSCMPGKGPALAALRLARLLVAFIQTSHPPTRENVMD